VDKARVNQILISKSIDRELILFGANTLLTLQQKDGSIKSGCNGPYGDIETSVRNTSHALILFCSAISLCKASNNDSRVYEIAMESCLSWLLNTDLFSPLHQNYVQRKSKDIWNGVIGVSWVLESLCYYGENYGRAFVRNRITALSSELNKCRPFQFTFFSNNISKIDRTFNHQLWAVYSLARANLFLYSVESNFDNELKKRLIQDESGLICHPLNFLGVHSLRNIVKLYYHSRQPHLRTKEIGYQTFNILALNNLSKYTKSDEVRSALKKALSYVCSEEFKDTVTRSRYSTYYNNPYIELSPLIQELDINTADWVLKGKENYFIELKRHHYDEITPFFDYVTSVSRLYELVIQ